MRCVLAILALLCCATAVCAQTTQFPPGVLLNRGALDPQPATYTGPGDVVSGANAAYGLRAYTAATRGNKLINACNSTGGSDVACADMVSSASTGFLVSQTIGGITCPGANCTIKTWYDISGATNCSSAACDVTQATVANRAALTANIVGGHACGVFSATPAYASAASITTVTQAFTISAVYERTGNFTSFGSIIAGGGGGVQFGSANSANTVFMNASSSVTATASDSAFHATQFVVNGSSSLFYTDGSASGSVNPGAGTFAGAVDLGGDPFSQKFDGPICEVLIYGVGLNSTQQSNMNSNQHSAWGF